MKSIDRYQIEDRIGRGMQGTVYRAHDPVLDRRVAVKLLHSDDLHTEDTADTMTMRPPLEAQISSKLNHPGIIPIFDIGSASGVPYLVFDFVEGQTLRELMANHEKFSIERVCTWAVPILDAVAHAHGEGIIHLDLGPRNIIIDRQGRPRIMDFGLSQFVHKQVHSAEEIQGSLLYMAPEYFRGKPVGPPTDVWAIGSVLFALVTGTTAVDGESFEEVVDCIVNEPADLSRLPDSPYAAGFGQFLRGSLQKDARLRYRDCAAMRDALLEYMAENGLDSRARTASFRSFSTAQFLLRRMQRKPDFSAVSRVLTELNRSAFGDSEVEAQRWLATVIGRDVLLGGKLLELVYATLKPDAQVSVDDLPQAVAMLGANAARSTASSLAYCTMLGIARPSPARSDGMIRAFLGAILSRFLAQRAGTVDPEDAFLSGLFQDLGQHLALAYFPEDYAEIMALVAGEFEDPRSASQLVLGVSFGELGAEVARLWRLPAPVVATILASSRGTRTEAHGAIAGFVSDLCELIGHASVERQDEALSRLLTGHGAQLDINQRMAVKLLKAGLGKLRQSAAPLELDIANSQFCRAALLWLRRMGEVLDPPRHPAPVRDTA